MENRDFPQYELADLEQELLIAYLKDIDNYDPSRGDRETFLRMIIHHRYVALIRESVVEKRKIWLKACSFEVQSSTDTATE